MLKEITIKCIESDSGMSISEIQSLSPYAEKKVIQRITGKSLVFSKKRDYRKVGRGNPLIARREIKTIEDVDKELSKVKWKRKK